MNAIPGCINLVELVIQIAIQPLGHRLETRGPFHPEKIVGPPPEFGLANAGVGEDLKEQFSTYQLAVLKTVAEITQDFLRKLFR